jgi:hypothetical protein
MNIATQIGPLPRSDVDGILLVGLFGSLWAPDAEYRKSY